MKQSLLLVFCFFYIGIFATTAWDTNLKVRGSMAVEWNRACAITSDGGMIYVWSDTHANGRDLYAQRVNAQGIPLWSTPLIVDNKIGAQRSPVIQKTSDGFFIIAWIDSYVYNTSQIYLQKINESGQKLWQEGGIAITTDPDPKSEIRLTPDALGGMILTWTLEGYSGIRTMGQSIAPNGALRWQEGGVDLTIEQYYTISSIVMDGSGGFVISYSTTYVVASRVYLNRFNAAGIPVWNAPVCIGNDFEMNRNGLMTLGNGVIYLLWYSANDIGSYLKLQLFDLNGQTILTEPYQFTNQGIYCDSPEELIYSPADNTILISLISYVGNNLYLQKFSSSGLPLWGNGVLVDAATVGYYSAQSTLWSSDTDGGCCISWGHYAVDQAQPSIYIQRFNAAGSSQWGDPGVLLNINEGYWYQPALRIVNDHIWASWVDQRGSQSGVYYQILNLNGNPLLEPNGRSLVCGLNSMYSEGMVSLTRGNDTVLFWNDDRNGYDRTMIYMQEIAPDGTTGFATGGIPVTLDTGGELYIEKAKVVSGDRIVLLWQERHSGRYDLYAQLLDSSGSRLWGENGIRLTYLDNGRVSNSAISQIGGDFFIGWTHLTYSDNNNIGKIMMQKISDGQIQWGACGRSVIQDAATSNNSLCSIEDNWLVYERRLTDQNNTPDLYVMRFDPSEGAPLAGWSPVGRSVEPGSGQSLYHRPFSSLKLTQEGLFILFSEYVAGSGNRLMAQRFSPEGQVLLGQTATQVDLPWEGYNGKTTCGANDFIVLWTDYQDEQSFTKISRVGYDLIPLWEALTVNNYEYSISNMQIARFPNDALALVWQDYDDQGTGHEHNNLKYRFVTQDGGLIGAVNDYHINLTTREAYNLNSTVIGNRVLLSWSDGPANYEKDEPIEHTNLWAQMIINETSAAYDPSDTPSVTAELYPNYPNPFNPSTTIKYYLNAPTRTELTVYNLKGQMIRNLVSGEIPEGIHTTVWDGRDASGRGVASGVYFYRLMAGKEAHTGKMLLVK